jgi:hypothetical protein
MSMTLADSTGRGALRLAGRNAAVLSAFAGTLFLSALLLFSVQPVFAKMVLPKLGGTPAVWAVSMVFFQAALLAGYCYAHALNRWLPGRLAPFLHLALCGAAALALPFGLPQVGDPPAGDAYLWLIGVLALGVGLPFFAVSANAPLLQAWFARTGHPSAADPYFLYGASNLGSFVALLAYPFLIEPAFGLSVQAAVWTGGFILLATMIAGCGLVVVLGAGSEMAAPQPTAQAAHRTVSWSGRAMWIGLAFVPSGLLVAFSSYIATDIASAPLLWVLPLALFLATFMLVFCERPPIPHSLMLMLQPVLTCLAILGFSWPGNAGTTLGATFGFAAFFVTMMVCHRELYERRPEASQLTGFYLWMSLGGVLGGIFAAIVAPQIFNAIYELPLLLLAGIACRPGLPAALRERTLRRPAWLILAVATGTIAAIVIGFRTGVIGEIAGLLLTGLVITTCASAIFLVRHNRLAEMAIAAAIGIGTFTLPSAQNLGHAERSFFGVHRVHELAGGEARMLLHGTTLHGIERLRDAFGRPIEQPVPASYYHPASPMALGIEIARSNARPGRAFAVGIVGLGAGSMACYKRANEAWRYFEIDPSVVRIARDASLFRFLSRCDASPDIVLGDARLTLNKEHSRHFDYLVIDAFSSDAVPVHLLTREALELYLDKLGPDGLLALHISNRHLDLVGVVSALAASIQGIHAAHVYGRGDGTLYTPGSSVAFISRSERTIAGAMGLQGARALPPSSYRAWTDERSDILSVLWRTTK